MDDMTIGVRATTLVNPARTGNSTAKHRIDTHTQDGQIRDMEMEAVHATPIASQMKTRIREAFRLAHIMDEMFTVEPGFAIDGGARNEILSTLVSVSLRCKSKLDYNKIGAAIKNNLVVNLSSMKPDTSDA